MLVQEDHDNSITWQIVSQEKFMSEMDRNFDGVLLIIFNMKKIYIEYLNKANKADS